MIIAVLLLAALSLEVQVFPEPLCENLPEVTPEVKSWVAGVAPELAQVRVRELPEKTALDVFRRAAAAGWGSVEVLTQSVFREPCTFYLSRGALRAVDAAFDLDLLTVIRGHDTKGRDFEMAAILVGRGKVVVLYDRDGIVYRNGRLGRDFKLASRVEFETPSTGVIENVQGLCAKVRLFGCVRIRSVLKVGQTLKVQAGTFTSEIPMKPIQAREGRSVHARRRAPEFRSFMGDSNSCDVSFRPPRRWQRTLLEVSIPASPESRTSARLSQIRPVAEHAHEAHNRAASSGQPAASVRSCLPNRCLWSLQAAFPIGAGQQTGGRES